jgi:hypothetical protein
MANSKSTMARQPAAVPGVTITQGAHGAMAQSQSGGPQLTGFELLESISREAATKFEAIDAEEDAHQAASVAWNKKNTEFRQEVGDAEFNFARIESHPNATKEEIERARVPVTKAKAKAAAHEATRSKTGTVFRYVSDFINSRDFRQSKWRPAVVPEPEHTFDGDDVKTLEQLKSQKAQQVYGIQAAERAPVPTAQIESRGKAEVAALMESFGEINAKGIARMVKDESGRLHQGIIDWPRVTVVGGTADNPVIYNIVNAAAILAECFSEQLTAHVIAKAKASVNPDAAMNDAERREIITAARAEIEVIERMAERVYWRLRSKGIAAERLSVRPECILGIERMN